MNKLMKKIKLIVVISCLFMLSSSFVFSFQSKKTVISNNLYLAKGYANYIDDAKYNFNNYGILPSLVLAVGQKEQSWKAPSWNNVFGITYSSGTCGWDDNSNAPTNPSLFPDWSAYKSSGKYKYTNGYTYRAYNSVSDSVKDFGAWLTNCYSLRDKIKSADTIEEQLLGMINYNAKGNLDYVCGLAKIINSQDFTQYDVGLTNGEHKQINLSDLGCDKETEEETENENYFTSYEGSSTDGWLYNRLKYTEEWKQFDVAIEEADIDDSINEIFRRAKLSYEAYTEEYGEPGLAGEIIIGRKVGGALPDYIKNYLKNPLGNQACNQSSCFGYYSSSNCSAHSGVDLTSSVGSTIYSAGDGIVTAINSNSKQCQPDFKSTGAVCSPGCTGNIVTIKHTVNGEAWTTKYVHMLSINSEIKLGANLTKGQAIGIIGTSGCSTGIHLHFEIIGPNDTLYNPEELISESCNLKSDCVQARQSCKR